MLKDVYGHEGLSNAQVFEWFKKIKEGRETPWTTLHLKTEASIKKIGQLIRENPRLSVRAAAPLTEIDKESV